MEPGIYHGRRTVDGFDILFTYSNGKLSHATYSVASVQAAPPTDTSDQSTNQAKAYSGRYLEITSAQTSGQGIVVYARGGQLEFVLACAMGGAGCHAPLVGATYLLTGDTDSGCDWYGLSRGGEPLISVCLMSVVAAPPTGTNNQSVQKTDPPANGPSESVHLSAKEQEALDWVKCNGVTIGYIPITGSATCPVRQFTQLSPKEQEAMMWLRRVAPLCGYALRDDIASLTDYRREDQVTDKEKEAIAWMRKVGPLSGFLLRSDIESTQSADRHAFGTGFVVSSEGHILTNNHVVAECKTLATRDGKPLRLISRNVRSDLALLKADTASTAVAVFRTGPAPKMGDAVVAFGFPLPDLLSSEGNVATGILSATSGLQDDVRFVQISAPVQPGNSGGPLLDQSGHVIGVVVAKLDTLRVARAIGDIPQNVNFAIRWSEVRAFLDEEGVPYRKTTSQQSLSTPDVAALARRMSVLIDCTE